MSRDSDLRFITLLFLAFGCLALIAVIFVLVLGLGLKWWS